MNNCRVRFVASFQFLHQRFACTVVCELFIFNLDPNGHRWPFANHFFFSEGRPDAFLWGFLCIWCTLHDCCLCWMKNLWHTCCGVPGSLVIQTAAFKQTTLAIRDFGDWLQRSPSRHNISSFSVVSAFDARRRLPSGGSILQYFATVDKLFVLRNGNAAAYFL